MAGQATGPVIGYLGFGANVGDRLRSLNDAVVALCRTDVEIVARSSLYETAPQGEVKDQPDFLNAAARIVTDQTPRALLELCKAVERELGREAGAARHGPRTIDIDLLLLGNTQLSSDRLTLPHREVLTRHFVLAPLLELDPLLVLPNGARLADSLRTVVDQPVIRLRPVAGWPD